MRNKGFVTDSDTEKELQGRQNAKGTAVDENKIRQQYKNRLNNAQGQHFEREILAGCRMYERNKIASIDKTPEPFRVTSKNHRTGEFTGRFSTHAQPVDPMIMFAEIYGEWNEYRGNYKWQSLTKCATYYGYEFKAHDSLEDVKATLYAYKEMRKREILKEVSVRG